MSLAPFLPVSSSASGRAGAAPVLSLAEIMPAEAARRGPLLATQKPQCREPPRQGQRFPQMGFSACQPGARQGGNGHLLRP